MKPCFDDNQFCQGSSHCQLSSSVLHDRLICSKYHLRLLQQHERCCRSSSDFALLRTEKDGQTYLEAQQLQNHGNWGLVRVYRRIQEDTFFDLWECAMGVTATEGVSDVNEDGAAAAAAAAATLAAVAVAAMVFCAPSRS